MRSRNSFLFVLTTLALLSALTFLSPTSRAQEENNLKSAEELVALLKSRLYVDYEIPDVSQYQVLACEQRDHVIVLYKTNEDWNKPEAVVWKWDPNDSLPPELAKTFGHVDECKPAKGTSLVLVSSSGGGVAVVRYEDKKLLFFGRPGGNTHSIAMLPDGNIVTASSTGAFVALFIAPDPGTVGDDVKTTPIAKKYPLDGGHGVVWDAKRRILWALGTKKLVGYEYNGEKENPELKEVYSVDLEGEAYGGHDLYPAPGYDALVTTGRGVSVFDPETRTITPVLKKGGIKSVSITPEGATMIQLAVEEWWNESLLFGDAKETKVGTNTGARFYKARWFIPNKFSEP